MLIVPMRETVYKIFNCTEFLGDSAGRRLPFSRSIRLFEFCIHRVPKPLRFNGSYSWICGSLRDEARGYTRPPVIWLKAMKAMIGRKVEHHALYINIVEIIINVKVICLSFEYYMR